MEAGTDSSTAEGQDDVETRHPSASAKVQVNGLVASARMEAGQASSLTMGAVHMVIVTAPAQNRNTVVDTSLAA